MIDLSLSAKGQAIHAIIKDRQGEVNHYFISKYYNLIKATTNIFDVACTSPHYNEYLNLLRNEVMVDLSLSAKSQAIHAIIKDRQGEVNFFGDDVNRIAKYVEGLIVRKWLLSKKFKFTLPAKLS